MLSKAVAAARRQLLDISTNLSNLVRGEDLDRFARVLRRLVVQRHSRAFFKCRRFFERGRFRVLRTWLLDRPAEYAFNSFPAPLRSDRGEVEFASHPSRNLAARPQPAIGRRVCQGARRRNLPSRSGFMIVAGAPLRSAQVAKSLGSLGYCSGRAIVRSIARHRPLSPTLARWCDHAPKARLPGSAAMPVASPHPTKPLFQLLDTQMIPDRRHVSQSPDLRAPKLICFARPRESPVQRPLISRKPYQRPLMPRRQLIFFRSGA